MKLSNIRRHIGRSCRAWLCLSVLTMPIVACESIYEGEGDCSRVYQVSFTYTMNIREVEAFSSSVKSVSLFIFDGNGKLAACKTETGDKLSAGNYAMSFEDIAPGTYDLIAWGGLEEGDAFELADGENPVSKEDLVCRLNRSYDENHAACSARPLNALFHGMAVSVEFPEGYGVMNVATLDLTKNTNTVRIVLHNNDGRSLDENKFHFTITDNNGLMNYDNALLADEYITYREWTKRPDTLPNPDAQRSNDAPVINCVVAEIDVARLVEGQKAVLRVEADGKDEPIVDLPLIDLLLVAKGEARRQMDSQEYLDRQDEYTMFFRLDDNDDWYIKGGIFVNGWKMVSQDTDM